jgi:NADH:ubiquinone oxidoreductase subunit H
VTDVAAAAAAHALVTVAVALLALPLVALIDGIGARGGHGGALSAVANALRLLEKRAPVSSQADTLLHRLAPVLAIVPCVAGLAVLPTNNALGLTVTLPFALALPLVSTAAVAVAGVAGDNRLALLSALRLAFLRTAVVIVIAVAAIGPAWAAGSLDLDAIARGKDGAGGILGSGAVIAPGALVAVLLAIAVLSQQVRRARTEPLLVEPWLAEAAGPVLLGHRVFEAVDLAWFAALVATLFLGGPELPGAAAAFSGGTVLVLKAIACGVVAALLRTLLPPLSNAQSLRLCLLVLVPLALSGVVTAALWRLDG